MTPNRVAYVVNVFPKLSETFIAGELAELRRRGVELRVFSLRVPREWCRHEMIARAELDKITCYRPEEFSSRLREFKPQLLHAHFATEPTAAARELAKELGVPFTFTAHGYDIRRKPPPDFAGRATTARAVITVSNANARYIAKTFNVPREHIRVIPCGVDTDRFRPAEGPGRLPEVISNGLRERQCGAGRNHSAGNFIRKPVAALRPDGPNSPAPEKIPLIVCVARHVKVKNLGLLLEACVRLRDGAAKFCCIMIGDCPLRGELEEMRQRLGLHHVVEFPGALQQADVLKGWQRASIAVLTSENEGMPVCLMEAAACGIPAVATAVGGVPELILNGRTGLLVPPGDATALAAALQTLLQDAVLAHRMGDAARKHAEGRFSVRAQVDRLLALWAELLQSRFARSTTSGNAQ